MTGDGAFEATRTGISHESSAGHPVFLVFQPGSAIATVQAPPESTPVFFYVIGSPDVEGIVAFRGQVDTLSVENRITTPLPHAVQLSPKNPADLFSLTWEGELEVCRVLKHGEVEILMALGVPATKEACKEQEKALTRRGTRMTITSNPALPLPPLELLGMADRQDGVGSGDDSNHVMATG